jgi:hypothetical protein
MIENEYRKFAEKEGVDINFIKTNMSRFNNQVLLSSEFGKYTATHSWWQGVQHGVALLGLCAPLTIVKRIGTLLIASSVTKEYRYQIGSHPLIDNKVSWASVKVVHDSFDVSRQEKIRLIKTFIENRKSPPLLKVCFAQHDTFNCSKCEKCLRTIAGLTLENIDSNMCGFSVDGEFFGSLKQKCVKGGFFFDEAEALMWKDIQSHIPAKIEHNLLNSKEFMKWFKNFSISTHMKGNFDIKWFLLDLFFKIFYRLPKNSRKAILKRANNNSIEYKIPFRLSSDMKRVLNNLR